MTIAAFVEALPIYKQVTLNMSNSIDTTPIDAYRQGIELTLDSYFCNGIVKIWNGEKDHQITQNIFGQPQEEIYPEKVNFTDLDYFNPVVYVQQQLNGGTPSLTYPIVFQSSVTNPGILDGIIEPLAIRQVAQFTSIDAPFESHAIYGNIEAGNHNKFTHSDIVLTKVEFAQENKGSAPYEDNVDNFNGTPIGLGFFPNNEKKNSAYDDSKVKSGLILDNYIKISEIFSATLDLNPSTDNFIPTGYKSYSTGFSWVNNNLGTDSLSFGDQTYKRK